MDVGALDTLGLTLSKYDMVRFASVALRAEGGAFSLDISPNFKVFFYFGLAHSCTSFAHN